MASEETRTSDKEKPMARLGYRVALAVLITGLVIDYTAGVVSGHLPVTQKIDSVHLVIIVLAVLGAVLLVNPGALDRLKLLELSGFKLEMLERVRDKQAKQETQLEDIALMLPLLLPATERNHLLNLADYRTGDYRGGHSMRSELRRLRSIGLIEMRSDHRVAEMTDRSVFDLANYVKLTDLGERWVRRIKEIEKAEAGNETG